MNELRGTQRPTRRSRKPTRQTAGVPGAREDDPIEVLDPRGPAWTASWRLGISTVGALDRLDVPSLIGVRGIGCAARDGLEALQRQARVRLHGPVGARMLEPRLVSAGIDLDTPWERCLGVVTGRGRRFLHEGGMRVLGEIARALDTGMAPALTDGGRSRPRRPLLKLPFVGRGSIREVRNCVESLCDLGVDRHVFGPKGRPATVDDLVDRMLERSDSRRRTALTLRVLEGRLLLEVAEALDCSPERVRMLVADALVDLGRRFDWLAREMTDAVRAGLVEGVPIDAAAVRDLCGSSDPRRACLAIWVAGMASARVDRAGRLLAARPAAGGARAVSCAPGRPASGAHEPDDSPAPNS